MMTFGTVKYTASTKRMTMNEGKKSMCIVKLSSFFVSFQSWRVGRGNASNPSHCQRKLGYNLAGYILGFQTNYDEYTRSF